MTQHRRRVKQTTTLDERLSGYANLLRVKAKAMPRLERDRVLKKARQFEVALDINDWLTAPALQPHKSGPSSGAAGSKGSRPPK